MSVDVHPLAVIEEGAQLGAGCRIGAFCHVGPHVTLGANNVLHTHAVIDGHTTLGDDNEVYSHACLGKISQDLKFNRAWTSYTRIGRANVFREYVTVNASSFDQGVTVIGDGCSLLSYSHVAHDCILGDRVIISTDSKIAGHVEVGDGAVINAKTGVVQFVRIGRYAFIGGFNKVTHDVLPFCLAEGFPSSIRAVNKIGLDRNGFSADTVRIIEDAFRTMLRSNLTLSEAVERLQERYVQVPEVQEMIAFAQSSKTGLARPRKGAHANGPVESG